ncbi:MAG: 4Fe-4S binding protein [Candidatus Dojkabacteria bacterium]|nr:4Fe-4S binding protein [Candidatus Dojkabacteria bacterium]
MIKEFKPVITENDNVRHIVFAKLCKGCRLCQQVCPQKCLKLDETNRGVYNNQIVKCDVETCIACGLCEQICPDRAIKVEKKEKKS